MSFAIPGAFPPRAEKAERRVVAADDGALQRELFRTPVDTFPLQTRVMIASQDDVVWLAASRADETLFCREDGGQRALILNIPAGTLPPGMYRAYVWGRNPGTTNEIPELDIKLGTFTVPNTPFTAAAFSKFKPLGDLAGLIAANLAEKGILEAVVGAAQHQDYWSYWET